MQTRSERTPTQFYIPNTKTEISISSTLAEMIESSKFRSASAIRKKPLKFNHARQVFTDLGDPYKQNELRIKIGSCLKFECPKDPDVNPLPTLTPSDGVSCRARPSVALASDGRLVVASVGRTAYRSSACDSTMTYKKPSAQRRRLWLAGEPGREERRQRLSLARCQAQPALTGRAVMRSTLRGHWHYP